MNIEVLKSKGKGITEKTAYDSALKNIGLHNCNIVTLSSVIPSNSKVEVKDSLTINFSFGDVVYAVQSKRVSNRKNSLISSGLAWCMRDDKDGGVFLEQKATTEDECRSNLRKGINEMKNNRDNMKFEDHNNYLTVEKKVEDNELYQCVLAIAVYDGTELSPII